MTVINTLNLETGEITEETASPEWLAARQAEIDTYAPVEAAKRQRERKREQGAARIKQFDIVALEAEVNALPIAVRSPMKKMFQLVRLLIQERELNDADVPPDS